MANQFRQDVEVAIKHLDDTAALNATRTWYRNGSRGNLHARPGCYKCETWNNTKVDHSIAEASRKRTCTNCCALDNLIERAAADAVGKVQDMLLALDTATTELGRGDALDVGVALNQLERVDATLDSLTETEADKVSGALATIRARNRDLRVAAGDAAARLRSGAASWAASAIALRNVHRDEHSVPGATPNDYVVFGANRSGKGTAFDDLLGRIYLRWSRLRATDRAKADARAVDMLEDAVLEKPAQLDFPVGPDGTGANLLERTRRSWHRELVERLDGRLLPIWEQTHAELEAKTDTKLVGIHGEVTRDETRSLLAAHPGTRRGNTRLALVPEVVALYIRTIEKHWSTDVVEVADGCEPELLDTVAALWEPGSRDSEFSSLATALHAASAV